MGKKRNNSLRDNSSKGYGVPDDISKLRKELVVKKDNNGELNGEKQERRYKHSSHARANSNSNNSFGSNKPRYNKKG